MATLYLTEPGSRLEKAYGRLLVTKDDETLLEVALELVSEVVLVGNTGVTTPALHSLLHADVPLILTTQTGRLLGRLAPPTAANLPLRQAQYRRNDDPAFCLEMAQAVVVGKLRNQRSLAARIDRREDAFLATDSLNALDQAILDAGRAGNMDELLGIEGQAARFYLSIYRQAFDPPWTIQKRVRRPPKDPVNALLSLGYTFLGYAAISALEIAGLDPYLGYFHAEAYGRPALALDLIEEFRSVIVDSLVLNMLNRDWLKPENFETDPETGGVRLDLPGLREFLAQFSRKLEDMVYVRRVRRRLSYRKILEVQARRLRGVIEGKLIAYEPYLAR